MKLLIAFLLCYMAFSATAQQKNSIPFNKLAGTWITEKKDGTIMCETWTIRNEIEIDGKSYMIKNADTTILETVCLLKKGGNIFYIPLAYGQNDDKPVPFKLTAVNGTAYIFENPEHDFPKRIVYDFTAPDTLHAYIDDGTEKKRQDYYYKKQK